MTNREKYLKDGVDVEKIAREIDIILQNDVNIANAEQATIKYFNSTCKPTLTEDERVILNHINVYEFDKLGRAKNGDLYLCYREDKDTEDFWWCNDLFQFIKERRGI